MKTAGFLDTLRLTNSYMPRLFEIYAPEEMEFFEREFGLSDENDPNEGIFSYIRQYDNGKELIVSHSPFSGKSFFAKLQVDGAPVFEILVEEISSIAFQAWGDEKIIRVYAASSDIRLSYSPEPVLRMGDQNVI